MRQVLFWIPTPWYDIPIYGFGTMLVVALFASTWLAGRRAERSGIAKEHIQDLALWVVISGVVGARLVFMIQYGRPVAEFFKLWEGGLVFYGSMVGGILGYVLAYFFVMRKHNLSWRKVADVIAPSAALGLAIGRIGCLLNGCCYGDVACPECYAIHFPLSAFPRYDLVRAGYQTAAGFTLRTPEDFKAHDPRSIVDQVELGSPAWNSGLRSGDLIVAVDGLENKVLLKIDGPEELLGTLKGKLPQQGRQVEEVREGNHGLELLVQEDDPDNARRDTALATSLHLDVHTTDVFWDHLADRWPRGQTDLKLRVRQVPLVDPQLEAAHRRNEAGMLVGGPAPLLVHFPPPPAPPERDLPEFTPRTLGLHPTQLYETISTGLLFLVLLAYFPLRRHDGEVFALFMIGYAIHRFLNELLRNDTTPVALGMTLSENVSIIVLLAGVILLGWLLRRPAEYPEPRRA